MIDSEEPNPPKVAQAPRRGGRTLAFFIGLTLFALGLMAGFHYFVARPALSPVERFAAALGAITQEKVEVSGQSVTIERGETRELAVVQRKVQSMVKYETKWMNSDKLLIVQGDFLVKAGFDLADFQDFELKGNEVVGEWPRAKVLSVEQLDHRIFFSKNGVVNKIQESDYEAVANLLQKQARQDALEKSDILEDAERVLQRRLNDLSGGAFQLEIP